MNRNGFLLILILSAPLMAGASFHFTPACRQAYGHMVRLQFDAARQVLENDRKAHPDNFIPEYVESYIDFLTAFISEEPSAYEVLRTNRTARLALLDREDRSSPYFRLIRAELFLQTAVVRVKKREYIASAYEFRKAYRLLEANDRQFPSFMANKKCLGVLHALIGYVPSDYKWLTRLLGFRGTIAQGLGELNALLLAAGKDAEHGYLFDETAILLMFLQFNLEKNNQQALALASRIEQSDPGPLHLFSVLGIYLYSARNDRAIELLANRKKKPGEYPFYYLDYMMGLGLLNKLDGRAAGYFRTYVNGYKGSSFIKAAYQKLSWIALMEGDTSAYKRWQQHVLSEGDDFTDEDKHALNEVEKDIIPNVYLLRARLLFDGGYYKEALAELAGKDLSLFPRFADRLEFIYRLARIYDKAGLRDRAVRQYEQTVTNGEAFEYYYAANAALYLGRIHENEGNREEAIAWYRRCLGMRNHEYQNSIDQRAEAGLNRLGAQ